MDGSNEVNYFGQNHLEASCPWSTYLKRFPDFGLTSQTESMKEWNLFGGERSSERNERGKEMGSASAMTTPKLRQQSITSYEEKNENNDSIKIKDNNNSSLTAESNSVINHNISDKSETELDNQVGNRREEEKNPTKINDIKCRNLREISVNLSANSSHKNTEIILKTEIEVKVEVELKSKADVMYTFDSSLDYIHSEVRKKIILQHVMKKNISHTILYISTILYFCFLF